MNALFIIGCDSRLFSQICARSPAACDNEEFDILAASSDVDSSACEGYVVNRGLLTSRSHSRLIGQNTANERHPLAESQSGIFSMTLRPYIQKFVQFL